MAAKRLYPRMPESTMKTTTLNILGTAVFGCLFALGSPAALAQQPGGLNDVSEKPAPPNYARFDNFLIVVSPRGDKVASFNVKTRKSDLVRLSESDDTRLDVQPIIGPGVVALFLRGHKITRIAASDTVTGALIPQDLREPVDGAVQPIVGPGVAAYVIGRYAYAFSPEMNCWDVTELAAGHSKHPVIGAGTATVVSAGHIYTFSSKTGKWDHIDIDKLSSSGGDESEKQADPKQ
jgi:hypothetical protein